MKLAPRPINTDGDPPIKELVEGKWLYERTESKSYKIKKDKFGRPIPPYKGLFHGLFCPKPK